MADAVFLDARGNGCDPLVERALADLAQYGVDQAAALLADLGARERDHLADRGVRVDPHPEQLMRAEAEQIEQLRIQVGEWPRHGPGEEGVVRALPTQCAVHEFGAERGVATAQ